MNHASSNSAGAGPRCLGVAGNWLAHADSLDSDGLLDVILKDAAMVADAGFNAIELPIAHADPFIADLPEAYWQEVGAALREMDVEPISVHAPYYPTFDCDFDSSVARLMDHARAACALGVRGFVVHPVSHPQLHVTEFAERALEWDRRISLMVSDAIGDGATYLAIENTPHHSFNYLDKLLRTIDRANVGMCFDTGHYHVRPERDLSRTLQRFSRWIVHVHLSDNDGLSDQHCPPGEGTFDWHTFFDLIDMDRLNGGLLIELSAPTVAQVGSDAPDQTRRIFEHAHQSITSVLDQYFATQAKSKGGLR